MSHIWKDIDLIEGLRRRSSNTDKTYEDSYFKLTTLETRRLRGDLSEAFQTFKGFDNLKPSMFLNQVAHLQEVHLQNW